MGCVWASHAYVNSEFYQPCLDAVPYSILHIFILRAAGRAPVLFY